MKRTTWVLWAALMLAPSLAWAQPEAQKRAQIRQHIDDFIVQRSTQELGLDAGQASRFREIWSRYGQQIAGLRKEQGIAMKALKAQLAEATPNEAQLTQLANTIIQDKGKIQQLEAARTEELRHVLTPLQFAKGVPLAPKLQREVRLQLWQAAHPNAKPPSDDEE